MAGERLFQTVEFVDCELGEPSVIAVKEGKVSDLLVRDLDGVREGVLVAVPENCPRRKTFDPSDVLGCLSCVYAYTEYEDTSIKA